MPIHAMIEPAMPPPAVPPLSHAAWARLPARALAAQWLGQLRDGLLQAPLEPVLHPSLWRLRWIGLFTVVGHPLFGWIWRDLLPQPWESLWLRGAVALLDLPLLVGLRRVDPAAPSTRWLFSLTCWLQLPVFFSWMFLCNGGNTVWLASLAAMVLIYYHLTDWRLASAGLASGGCAAWLLFLWLGPPVPAITGVPAQTAAVVLAFAWLSGLVLGSSAANQRREHLRTTLSTMSIMAHELRASLSSLSLLGDAIRDEARILANDGPDTRLDQLAQKLHGQVRNMNHQIDSQIINARLLRLPSQKEAVSAAHLIRQAVQNYPYRSSRERDCVDLHVRRDFLFKGSQALFEQVIDNLLKNALKSLAAIHPPARPGDLQIEIGILQNKGRIVVTDRGTGIEAPLQHRIFEPFFSTDRGTGHGLGLAFCKRVIQNARGSIRVQSGPGKGATFTIELPLLR